MEWENQKFSKDAMISRIVELSPKDKIIHTVYVELQDLHEADRAQHMDCLLRCYLSAIL